MLRELFRYKTTFATILADDAKFFEPAKEAMIDARLEIESEISVNPLFLSSLVPVEKETESVHVERMVSAAKKAGTGPMAAVAGTIAWAGVEAMKENGAKAAVIDNGGDIALFSDKEIRIGLYAGNSSMSKKSAFIIPPGKEIYGVCTSSATVGPSISFGVADSVTVFSADVSLADAWATMICNDLRSPISEYPMNIDEMGVDGVFATFGKESAGWGILPEIRAAIVDTGLITSG
ncbi:ApbE family lipoprotein [Methanolacinia petrolearia DSM 11571]|uniref:UPF0280 protein Mpet_1605 n=1 Tax=Methanolacinia petrolearia (strain DSM 11571 / OCM 486 / SEBR 4847) TaxID=679926 RepID=E1RGR7_METP4|nr:UPF0280 family protein [Methanolacinia petrolearia]ADN36362.1 ApbE family lipoprotein [Methanolacinia petrolearia DSM 11571]